MEKLLEQEVQESELIGEGTFFSRLMKKEKLRFWQKDIIDMFGLGIFTKMKNDYLIYSEDIERYKIFFKNDNFPLHKEGWRIFRYAYEKIFGKL